MRFLCEKLARPYRANPYPFCDLILRVSGQPQPRRNVNGSDTPA